MDNMDWGEALDFVSFGHVNPDQLDDSDFYILVATQNVVGSPIIHNLIKMVRCLSGPVPLTGCSTAGEMGEGSPLSTPTWQRLPMQHAGFSIICAVKGFWAIA